MAPDVAIPAGAGQASRNFKDFKRRDHAFVNLLDGDTDWPAVMSELRNQGYDSTLIHEVGGDRSTLVDLGERMRRIVAM